MGMGGGGGLAGVATGGGGPRLLHITHRTRDEKRSVTIRLGVSRGGSGRASHLGEREEKGCRGLLRDPRRPASGPSWSKFKKSSYMKTYRHIKVREGRRAGGTLDAGERQKGQAVKWM
jgi:hypothetical protein